MRVKILLILIGLFFIVSCTCETKEKSAMPAIYIIGESQITEEPQAKTFVVGEEDQLAWLEETKQKRNELNRIRYLEEEKDTEEEFELKNKLSNVRRSIDNELIVGYNEELDNPRWKEVSS